MSLHSDLVGVGFDVIVVGADIHFPRKWGAMSLLAKHRADFPRVEYITKQGFPWVAVPGGFDMLLAELPA